MRLILALVGLSLAGCVSSHSERTKVPTLATVEDGICLHTQLADITMNFAEAEAVVRSADLTAEAKNQIISSLRANKQRRVFSVAPYDDVGNALNDIAAPALLQQGRVAVTDLRSKQVVAFVLVGWVNRGVIGPSFSFPDGTEFLRQDLMVE